LTGANLDDLFYDDDYKSIQRYLSLITSTFVLVATVVNFYFTLVAYEKVADNAGQINFLFDNWQTK